MDDLRLKSMDMKDVDAKLEQLQPALQLMFTQQWGKTHVCGVAGEFTLTQFTRKTNERVQVLAIIVRIVRALCIICVYMCLCWERRVVRGATRMSKVVAPLVYQAL